jgi:hypothetical protein
MVNYRNRQPWPALTMMAEQRPNAALSPTALRLQANQLRGLAGALLHPEAGIVLRGYATELDVRADRLEAVEQRVAGANGGLPATV